MRWEGFLLALSWHGTGFSCPPSSSLPFRGEGGSFWPTGRQISECELLARCLSISGAPTDAGNRCAPPGLEAAYRVNRLQEIASSLSAFRETEAALVIWVLPSLDGANGPRGSQCTASDARGLGGGGGLGRQILRNRFGVHSMCHCTYFAHNYFSHLSFLFRSKPR